MNANVSCWLAEGYQICCVTEKYSPMSSRIFTNRCLFTLQSEGCEMVTIILISFGCRTLVVMSDENGPYSDRSAIQLPH